MSAPKSHPGPAVTGAAIPPATGPSANWPTFNGSMARSGVSVSSPRPGHIRRSWTAAVDGQIYAQPLIVNSEVIVATENDTVYAIKETTGQVLWRRHLASPVTGGLPCGKHQSLWHHGHPGCRRGDRPSVGRHFHGPAVLPAQAVGAEDRYRPRRREPAD